MTKPQITGRTSWDALRKKLKAEKARKSNKTTNKKRKSDDSITEIKATVPEKLTKSNEIADSEPNLQVHSSSYLMALLSRDLTKTDKNKFDFSHDESLKLSDIETAFGHEAAYIHSKRIKSKEAQYYRKRFLDVDEAKKFDDPNFSAQTASQVSEKLTKEVKSVSKVTKALAIDCEMVGVGYKGKRSILARVSICNQFGQEVYDKFIVPDEKVVDYRTPVSGIRQKDLTEENGALPFEIIQNEVKDLLRGKLLVGHQLNSDLKVLKIKHPFDRIRDTARYFTEQYGKTPSLKRLVNDFLELGFQSGEHSSVQDAQAAMRIYTMHKRQWERELVLKNGKTKTLSSKT